MDQILLGLGAAGAALLIIAVAVAIWEHRRHMAEMRQQLAWSANTRDLLQAHAKDVDARLTSLTEAMERQQVLAGPAAHEGPAPRSPQAEAVAQAQAQQRPDDGQAAPRTTAHVGTAAVAMAAAQAAITQQWIDTEPMVLTSQVLDFDPTLPPEFSEH